MTLSEWIWAWVGLSFALGLNWLCYEVRKLRGQLAKTINVRFTDPVKIAVEDKTQN